jgi:hypothetical protein
MRQYDYQPMDRSLIDLRDQRDQLSIEISLLKDADRPDLDTLFRLQRNLQVLDGAIHEKARVPRA